jgi:hypothetical protein
MKARDTITVELPLIDALQVGQTLRTLARTKLGARATVPPGVRPVLNSVGTALAMAAADAIKGGVK